MKRLIDLLKSLDEEIVISALIETGFIKNEKCSCGLQYRVFIKGEFGNWYRCPDCGML